MRLTNFSMKIFIVFSIMIMGGVFLNGASNKKMETIIIKSKDGVQISADLYAANDIAAPFILLCHRAKWSRGEYREIAPKLNTLGFNCLAIDQRSGEIINDVTNETAKKAIEKGLKTDYIEAIPDITSSLEYVKKNYPKAKVILWGSSYSSSLCFVIAKENPGMVDAIVAFSPGEYFAKQGKSETYIEENAKKINIPVFITSKNKEYDSCKKIFDAIPSAKKTYFLPQTEGKHGSEALWEKTPDNKDYWDALKVFLKQF